MERAEGNFYEPFRLKNPTQCRLIFYAMKADNNRRRDAISKKDWLFKEMYIQTE